MDLAKGLMHKNFDSIHKAPFISNIQKWDHELAAIAQRWAVQCDHGHDKCRNIGELQKERKSLSIKQ